jgi:hypothetical protein
MAGPLAQQAEAQGAGSHSFEQPGTCCRVTVNSETAGGREPVLIL